MEGRGFHAFENTADPGAFGTAGIERVYQRTTGFAESLQRLIESMFIGCGRWDADRRSSAAREVVENGEQFRQTHVGDCADAHGDDERGCQNPAPRPQNGLLDAHGEQLRGERVQE